MHKINVLTFFLEAAFQLQDLLVAAGSAVKPKRTVASILYMMTATCEQAAPNLKQKN